MIPMNTYYLHDGTVLSGPFTLDELKAKKLKLLPFGVKAWKMEYCRISRGLKKTLFSTPPQIKSFVAPSTPLKNESANEVKKFARLNKKPLFLVAGMVVLIIGTLIFNSILE
jgi:hypothetical protein